MNVVRISELIVHFEVLFIKSESKKGPTFKNLQLVKNLHFLTYRHETWGKSLAREVIIFTKFHEDWAKNVDFSLMANF